jgi:hypothetical protein
MSEVLELLLDVIACLLEIWLGDFKWPDTTAGRLFWCVILLFVGGLIWWELH